MNVQSDQQSVGDHATLQVANVRSQIASAESALLQAVARHHYPEAAVFAVRLALEESLANAFLHGHRGLPPETAATVQFSVSDDFVDLSIEDQGPGFNPASVPDPTADEITELPSGRGLMLMRSFMSELRHEKSGAKIIMRFSRAAAEAAAAADEQG